jgi:hypothetical protein
MLLAIHTCHGKMYDTVDPICLVIGIGYKMYKAFTFCLRNLRIDSTLAHVLSEQYANKIGNGIKLHICSACNGLLSFEERIIYSHYSSTSI